MKLIITSFILVVLFLAGCSSCPVNDQEVQNAAKVVIEENTRLNKVNNDLEEQVKSLEKQTVKECNTTKLSLGELTKECEKIKLYNTSTEVEYIQRISLLEGQLEDCWMNNETEDWKEKYERCDDKLDDCRDDLDDCEEDLEDCEDN